MRNDQATERQQRTSATRYATRAHAQRAAALGVKALHAGQQCAPARCVPVCCELCNHNPGKGSSHSNALRYAQVHHPPDNGGASTRCAQGRHGAAVKSGSPNQPRQGQLAQQRAAMRAGDHPPDNGGASTRSAPGRHGAAVQSGSPNQPRQEQLAQQRAAMRAGAPRARQRWREHALSARAAWRCGQKREGKKAVRLWVMRQNIPYMRVWVNLTYNDNAGGRRSASLLLALH